MCSCAAQNSEDSGLINAIDDLPRLAPVICPICGCSFVPRTSKQIHCQLECFAEHRRKHAVHTEYL